jgi:uncharacterized protein YndB with AHSA1/START domain/biotin operon repressor
MDAPFKVIADPTRRRILQLVADRERSAGEIAAAFAVTRPAVSQHLAALKRAGMVSERRQGTRRLYRARPEGLGEPLLFLQAFWDGRLARLRRAAEAPGDSEASQGTERVTVTREILVAAPPGAVWVLLADAERMPRWMGRVAELDPRPGGTYRVEVVPGQVASGTFLDVDPPRRLVHTWGWEGYPRAVVPPGATVVSYLLEPVPAGTLLRLEHAFLPTMRSAGSHARGWAHYLERLADAASGGAAGPDPWVHDAERMRTELRP